MLFSQLLNTSSCPSENSEVREEDCQNSDWLHISIPVLEFKEETVKVNEFDEEYLRELEKDLTEEEKEVSVIIQLLFCHVLQNLQMCTTHNTLFLCSTMCIVLSSTAIELNPNYVRAILRRAELYEKTDKLDEALEDYKSVLEKDPGIPAAREACMVTHRRSLKPLKDLGNMILRPFGLSTSNFQVNQDANTGSYSINFVQNPNNNNR
uniref:Tetratricopeptide repeat domain 1 n=1 Tax=Sinocyclocheilus grahami TaxID=75366 RepID=A0A672JY30_SINGR